MKRILVQAGHGPVHPVDTQAGSVTPNSALIAARRARADQVVRLMLASGHGGYSDADVRMIVANYSRGGSGSWSATRCWCSPRWWREPAT